jgi:two-component system, LytTR family, sensor kinase
MFHIRYRFGFMLLLGAYSFVNTLLVETFDYYHVGVDNWIIFLLFLVVTSAIWEGNRIWDGWLARQDITHFWLRICYNFAGSLVITATCSLLLGVSTAYFTLPGDWHGWILPLKLFAMFCFRINLFLNTIHIIFLYMQKLEQSHQELETYKRISSQAQLQSLRNQVNPHFLFNNLSVLSALISQDANASVEFVRQFSNVYRYILRSDEKELTHLAEEIEFIQSYLYLLKTRFNSGLNVAIDVSEGCLSAYILPVSLQMLVENAVKHNIISKSKPLNIEIFCRNDESITVRNNLQKRAINDTQSTQLGLTNIVKRYDFLGHHGVNIEHDDKYFCVTIPLIRVQS